MMIITGEQVYLRDPQLADFASYKRWFEPGHAWQEWDAPWEAVQPKSDEDAARWQEYLSQPLPEPRTGLQIETSDGVHVGWVNSYWVCQENHWRDCGIVIAESDYWGRGLGREAFTLWTDYLMAAHELPRIGMGTWGGNQRMIRLAARVGMRQEARFAGARLVNGRRYDAVRWGLLRDEWLRFRAPRTDGLRRYTPADWEDSVELVRQLYQQHCHLQDAPIFSAQDACDTLYDWLGRTDTRLWLWQESGQVVGLARARYDGVYFFEAFVVAQAQRRRGIGARFMAALEDELRAAGEQDVFLSMVWPENRAAVDFYCCQGYNLINTFELRKSLTQKRGGRPIELLGFHLEI